MNPENNDGTEPQSEFTPQAAQATPQPTQNPSGVTKPLNNPSSPDSNSSITSTDLTGLSLSSMTANKSKKRFIKPALLTLAAMFFLGGTAAAAYFGYIVPNKPENVLKSAVKNSLSQTQVSSKGTFEAEPVKEGKGLAMKVLFDGASNINDQTAAVNLDATVSGVNAKLEARYVEKSVYLKAGDLTPLSGLAGSFSKELAPAAKVLSQKLSNQWIVIDSTLIRQAGAGCILENKWAFSQEDINMLAASYQGNQFATIDKTEPDTINGKKVTKFSISINDDKLADYSKSLGNLTLVKNLNKCNEGKSVGESSQEILKDGDTSPLTVWVDKSSKLIVKVESHTTPHDEKKDGMKGTFSTDIGYDNVHIEKPENAKPALQVLLEVQSALDKAGLGGLLGSEGSNFTR